MNEVKAAFEKDNPDVTLTLVDNPFLGFHDKVINLFQAKQLADVVMAQVDWPVEFAELGILEPLDAFIAKEPKPFMDNIFPTFHKKWRGKQYYLPIETGPVALFYNTEIFKKAGIAGPPKTWDEYVAVAKKVTNPEQKIFATTGTMSAEPPTNLTYDLYPLIYQAGGDVIDERTNKAVFNSPAGVKAVQWYVDLMNVHKVSVPGILSSGEKEKRANFAAGNIAMMFEGSFGIPIQRQMNPNLQFDVAPMPRETTTGTVVRGAVNCMTTQARTRKRPGSSCGGCTGPSGSRCGPRVPAASPAVKTSPSRRGSRRRSCSRSSCSNCSCPTPSRRTWGCRMRCS